MAIIGVVASLFSGIMGFASSMQSAEIAKQEGKTAMLEARENAERKRRENERVISEQEATLGGTSGVELMGSPLEFILAETKRGELAARDIEQKGKAVQHAKKMEASQFKTSAYGSLLGGALKAGAGAYSAGGNLFSLKPGNVPTVT